MAADDPISRLPQAPPFLFISRVLALEPGSHGTGAWTVRGDESFLAGHFPRDPVVPGVLISEALAQLAGLVAGHAGHAGRLAQVNVKFQSEVRPPAEVRLEARVERSIGNLWLFAVRATCEEADAASGTIALALGERRRGDS